MSAANDNSLDLPIEIVSTIIHLLRRDSESLGKCCLVSQTWCSIARSLLWAAELRLFIGYPAKWNERLETHPLIERYISSLCLVGDGPPPRTFSESCAILLARFHHIDKLCIQAFIWGPQEQSMIESLDTSTVRELTLDRIRLTPQDFVHVMKRFPMLSSLRLLGCCIETSHSGSMISTVERVLSLHISEQPVRLEHLTLAVPTSLAFPCLMWLASPRGVDLSLTRTFALSWNITQVGNHSEFRDTFRSVEMRDAYIHFEKLLRRVSPAIRSLALLPCQTADNVENDPWLSKLLITFSSLLNPDSLARHAHRSCSKSTPAVPRTAHSLHSGIYPGGQCYVSSVGSECPSTTPGATPGAPPDLGHLPYTFEDGI